MKRILSLLWILALSLALVGCSAAAAIQDGTYRAEYDSFDVNGYKDFIEVTFENGAVTDVSMDAVSEKDGSLKSESSDYKQSMETVVGTYPEKYYKDLINQYIQSGTSDGVDIVAGATATSNSILNLLKALESELREGTYDGTIEVPRG